MEYDELKSKVKDVLKPNPQTVDEICEAVNIYDDFTVIQILDDLEDEGISRIGTPKISYGKDGGSIFLTRYLLS